MNTARRILAVAILAALPLACTAQVPINPSAATVNAAAPSDDFNDFNFRWRGYEDQAVTFTISGATLTAQTVATFKATRKVAGASNVVYIAVTCAVGASPYNVVTFSLPATNVPPDGTYLGELRASNAQTNTFRTLAQGKIRVTDSLFDDTDGSWAGNTSLNLGDYLTKVEAASIYGVNGGDVTAVTAGTGISVADSGGPAPAVSLSAGSIASLALADSALQSAATGGFTSAVYGDYAGITNTPALDSTNGVLYAVWTNGTTTAAFGDYAGITNPPATADYVSITNPPTIPSTNGLLAASWTNGTTRAVYGDYAGITNPPTIPSTNGLLAASWTNGTTRAAFGDFAGITNPPSVSGSLATVLTAGNNATAQAITNTSAVRFSDGYGSLEPLIGTLMLVGGPGNGGDFPLGAFIRLDDNGELYLQAGNQATGTIQFWDKAGALALQLTTEGVWNVQGRALTNALMNAGMLTSGTIALARLSGITSNQVAANTFGTNQMNATADTAYRNVVESDTLAAVLARGASATGTVYLATSSNGLPTLILQPALLQSGDAALLVENAGNGYGIHSIGQKNWLGGVTMGSGGVAFADAAGYQTFSNLVQAVIDANP